MTARLEGKRNQETIEVGNHCLVAAQGHGHREDAEAEDHEAGQSPGAGEALGKRCMIYSFFFQAFRPSVSEISIA